LAALLDLAMCALFVDFSSQELVDDCSAQVAVSAAAAQPKQVSIGYLYYKNQCFGSRLNQVSGSISVSVSGIRTQEGKNYPTKIGKNL
jgi:hypothetical protein